MSKPQNNKELVRVGHEFAKAMSADTPIIEIAKMMSRLAERLDCTTAALHETQKQRDELGEKLEAKDQRIAELSGSHSKLREAMAGIHNTITGGGAYTPLAAILNASKRAYEESAAAVRINREG